MLYATRSPYAKLNELLFSLWNVFYQIKNHYHEDPNAYVDAINDISNTRQAARTPTRDLQGVNLLFRYYNLLYYVERRFFPYGRSFYSIGNANWCGVCST